MIIMNNNFNKVCSCEATIGGFLGEMFFLFYQMLSL